MRVGIVGVGVVGRFIGRNLLAAGHELALHDSDPGATATLEETGALRHASAAEVAAASEVVISALPGPAEVEALTLGESGIDAGAAPGLVHLMTATIGPEHARRIAEASRSAGVEFVDAPLSAAPRAAEDQETPLTVWIGGSPRTYARLRPLIDAFARHALFCGPVGHAQVVKLVNNLTTLAFTRTLGDTLSLGVKAGVPLETLRAALTWGTAQSRLMDEHFGQSVFVGDWRPGYRVDLAEKDVGLAEELARTVAMDLPEVAELRAAFGAARERGWGDRSVHTIVRLSEEAAGVSLRLGPYRDREVLPGDDPGASGAG
jgi:3-hydroxyisobutyrate dehydrogenase-like beta-hydroxyacid dehydrogenase